MPALAAPDGGVSPCRLLRGPIALPIKGAVTLVARTDDVIAVQDDDGHPRVTGWPASVLTPPAAVAPEPFDGIVATGLTLGCAVAGEDAYCPDRTGGVHRAHLDGSGERVVASARQGTRVAAGALGPHEVVAYLASRQTSEGWVSEAWIEADDAPPIRLSEDGSGATSVTFATRGAALTAIMVDARAALTALHARPVSYESAIRLGEDAVIFVGGPGDRRTAVASALPAHGAGWALLPIAKDIGTFGLAVVRVDDPPQVDEPMTWSMYPNGLDPAPVAAVMAHDRAWVARIRPETSVPKAPRVLELGELREPGAFEALDRVATGANASDVALAADVRGALWLAWVDAAGSWVERLLCK